MLEYYEGALCIAASELEESGVMKTTCCRQLSHRGRLKIVRRGGGSEGRKALVSVDSLPERYKERVKELYPDGKHVRLLGYLKEHYSVDQKAYCYFMDAEQCGIELPKDKVNEYVTNASVLNVVNQLYLNARAIHRTMGEKWDWSMMSTVVEALREEFGHTLPTSMLRFRRKVAEYKNAGYACLISGKWGNQNTRKVNFRLERLIVSIACQPNKPFNTDTFEQYNMFMCGELDVYDVNTGELMNPNDYYKEIREIRDGREVKEKVPLELSQATISNYLNMPRNKVLIEHKTSSWTTFMHEQEPHTHRHGGEFALSQITMDDVDLTRKLKDTKQRIHAYYAYDVTSGCVIGASYGRTKTPELVVDCFRDMFRTIEKNGWGIPAGIEVENHLMTQWKDSFLKAGEVFPFVRFCAPQNSQEKYAEPLNGAKKRSVIHKNHEGIGRFYGKGKWRQDFRKISDETNETYEDREYYSWEQLIEEDRKDNMEWNNRPHPNQKMFPGMTRWQVLCERINPTLKPLDKRTVARYIGEQRETTVRRNSTVRVMGEDWWLSSPKVLTKLAANDYKVTACWLPDENGDAKDVYLFQGGKYIDKVEKVETYNRCMAEQTEDDARKFTEQQKKISVWRKWVKDNDVASVGVMKKNEELRMKNEELEEKENRNLRNPRIPIEMKSEELEESEEIRAKSEEMDYSRMGIETF